MPKNEELAAILREIKYKCGLNQGEIAKEIGISKQHLSDTLNGRFNFSDDLREKLHVLNTCAKKQQEEKIDTSLIKETEVEEPEIVSSNENEPNKTIYVLPTSAYGGRLDGFSRGIMPYECERMVSPFPDAEFAISVFGESMAPEYPNGSRVAVKKINEKSFIEWGKDYVLDTENGIVIKQIAPSEQPNAIRCISKNPDPIYAPFDLPKDSVFGMYIVLGLVARK